MATKICESIISQSNAVRTNVLDDVRQVVRAVEPDFDGVRTYTTDIVNWLKPVVDLSEFYVYPTNGITEGLNWWIASESRSIQVDPGDYQWVKETNKPDAGKVKYMSWPSAIDGNYKTIPDDVPVALDLAYVGSTDIRKISLGDNVEFVFYSLSKSFGIRNIRTGWLFTRSQDFRLDALINNAKYYNYYARDIAEKIISTFAIDYVYKTLNIKQQQICSKYNLTPSDSVWLATTSDKSYDKFKRGNKNRLCLAPCY